MVTKGVCSEAGCSKEIRSRGMCHSHYEKWRLSNPDKVDRRAGIWLNPDGSRKTCTVDRCDRPVDSKGLCTSHYSSAHYESGRGLEAARKYRPRSSDPRTCTFPGCDLMEFNPGFCAGHYYQGLRGETLRPLREEQPCPVTGCPNKYTVLRSKYRLCVPHRNTAKRHGLSREQLLDLLAPGVCMNLGCGVTENLHIDHDHSCCPPGKFASRSRSSCGECVRGVLCMNCNLSLGKLQENPRRIQGLLGYLESRG